MPLRQTIGISLALLMASAGAIAKTPEQGASQQSSQPPDGGHQKFVDRSEKARAAQRTAWSRRSSRLIWRRQAAPQIGRASWYDLVGNRTADGERLDTVTPTAAHRSLPLGSSAKVVDLDTGRSVIVKINDRGPFNRRFIIDLSPRAAEDLGMRYEGVAAVAVVPIAAGPAATAPTANLAVPPSIAGAYRIALTSMQQ